MLSTLPLESGLLDACAELGITPIGYSPLCLGILSGKYDNNRLPAGPRGLLPAHHEVVAQVVWSCFPMPHLLRTTESLRVFSRRRHRRRMLHVRSSCHVVQVLVRNISTKVCIGFIVCEEVRCPCASKLCISSHYLLCVPSSSCCRG